MSQIVLTGIGDPSRHYRLEKDPELTIGADEVLLQMEASPVNPIDFLFAHGAYAVQPQLPSTIGSEGVGRVSEVGRDADRSLVGKRVTVLGSYEQGVWADAVVVPARNVVVVPDDADPRQLSMLTNPLTAHLMLNKYVDLKPGDWIGQTLGNSALAHSVIALAKAAGVKTLSVVRSEKSAREARATGGDIVLVDGDDLGDRIAEALGGEQLRLVLDGAGGSVTGRLASAAEFGGTLVSYSGLSGEPPAVPTGDLVIRELVVRGFWVTNWTREAPREEIERIIGELVDLVVRGVISVPVDSAYSLQQYEEALARHASPERSGKVLFTFDAPVTPQA